MLSEGVDIGALEESRAGLEALDGAQHPENRDTQSRETRGFEPFALHTLGYIGGG